MKIAINFKKWLDILNILQNALKLSLVITHCLIDHIDKLAHALGLEPHGDLVFLPCAEQVKNFLDLVYYFGRMAELHMASNLAWRSFENHVFNRVAVIIILENAIMFIAIFLVIHPIFQSIFLFPDSHLF